jgi:hypothetical protein
MTFIGDMEKLFDFEKIEDPKRVSRDIATRGELTPTFSRIHYCLGCTML